MQSAEPTSASPSGATPSDNGEIRRQLERLLAHHHVRNSKRCAALLKYVVENAANGSVEHLKERTLGCDVFGRAPDYDTNLDSIVRTTAAEIRKRLAQYYLEPGHEQELRISLPPGSYVPEFRVSPLPLAPAPVPPVPPTSRFRPGRRFLPWVLVLLPAVGVAGLFLLHLTPTPLDRFWQPALSDSSDLVICIGQPSRIYVFDGVRRVELNQEMIGSDSAPSAPAAVRQRTSIDLTELKPTGERYFASGDLVAAVRIGELLGSKHKNFRIIGEKTAAYRDLRGKPVVLIGFNNNKWTTALMSRLRYYFGSRIEAGHYEIRDRNAGGKIIVSAAQGIDAPAEYAIVSRLYDPALEKDAFVVAGPADRSTGAAAEFLTNESYLREAFAKAPVGWDKKNVEVVIKADLVGGVPGPPTVVAECFW